MHNFTHIPAANNGRKTNTHKSTRISPIKTRKYCVDTKEKRNYTYLYWRPNSCKCKSV